LQYIKLQIYAKKLKMQEGNKKILNFLQNLFQPRGTIQTQPPALASRYQQGFG
jgi:hypothetical protein